MASPELPECPVCLQSYDGEFTIPRVLSCGHTACETCLKNLPQKYPLTIRCPACTQLVKYLSAQGPSSLPKNIDLLRLIPTTAGDGSAPQPRNHEKPNDESPSNPQVHQAEFLPRLWSDEFYSAWNNWVLPENAVLVEKKGTGDGFLKDDSGKVRLLKIGSGLLDGDVSGSVFKLSYILRVLNLLSGMKENEREEVGLILKICSRHRRICKAYGLWGDMVDGSLYLVFERLNGNLLEKLPDFEDGLNKDDLSDFAMMGMEICEAVLALHLKGLSLGCFNLACFELDCFGHLSVALCETLVTGRMVHKDVMEVASCGRTIGDKEMGMLMGKMLKSKVFVSPEVLLEIFKMDGVEIEFGNFNDSVRHQSDIWSLGCLLLTLLIGKQFTDKLVDYVERDASEGSKDNDTASSSFHLGLMEKVGFFFAGKFGEELESLLQILCSCLNFDPQIRPPVIDLWKCIRKLIIKNKSVSMPTLDETIHEENKGTNLVLGELCEVPRNALEEPKKDESQVPESSDERNPNQVKETKADKEFVDGLTKGNFKVKDMQGHLNCVTALTVGGGFLFSSSFDKSIRVWSLQDFSHVHTFKGHEHKVMAVIYVDEEEPLCISGDSGGGIFLWSISIPLRQEPVKKWYEQKDWRYSGIHALTTARNGYLYSGSGDRSIKAWSLQDGTLFCTMDGHKSVVSSLAICDGVLYSGSWDGSIRLWSLSDHSLLTVLGEDMPRTVTSVLSLIAHQNILIASHENGCIKIWRNDILIKSVQSHNGAIFAIGMEGKWLFTGGWDKNVNVQEILEDDFRVDIRPIGSTPGSSVVTDLLYWQGKLFVGHNDRTIKVYYYGK
uniref:Uncharacterized protein MANES_18G082000 n=2 Tax=Rhizophora mucronata TaxID=61149 RepID=A0A2P2KFF9_RHIMU